MKQQSKPSIPQGTRQVVHGFEVSPEGGDGTRHLILNPQQTFLPLGIFVSGVTDETTLRRVRVSNQYQSNDSPIPALWFQTRRSFVELAALAETGELEVPPSSLFEMDVLETGCMLTVEAKGPIAAACAWGLVYDGRRSVRQLMEVSAEPDGRHRGRILRQGLRGEEVLLEVSSPTETGVCTLLQNFRQHGFYG